MATFSRELASIRAEMDAERASLRAQIGALADRFAYDLAVEAFRGALSGQNIALAQTRHGPIFVRRGDLIGDAVLRTGEWDSHLYPIIEEIGLQGGSAVDVGAQFGTVSCVMARHFDKVISIEPNVESFKVLTLNAVSRPNLSPVNFCAYDCRAILSFSNPDEQDIRIPVDPSGTPDFGSTNNVGSFSFSEKGTRLNQIQALPLDDLDLQRVSLIKIDVQGADARVLLGARALIQRCRPTIIFEWEHKLAPFYGVSLDEIRAFFHARAYLLDVLKAHNDKQIDFIARPGT